MEIFTATTVRISDPARLTYVSKLGRVIAQAVSRRLPTAAARVRAHVRSCGICGGQTGTGAGVLRVPRFPLPILIPPTVPHSSSRVGAIGQLVSDVPSELSLTTRQGTKTTTDVSKMYCDTKCQDRCMTWRYCHSFQIGTEVLYIT
jgi:hypothetical protein